MYNALRSIRQEKCVTQEEVAKYAGVSRRTLYAIESGQQMPGADVALRIAQRLAVPLDKLFFEPRADVHCLPDKLRFIDLFCGIGGFRFGARAALSSLGIRGECVFSSDIDVYARKSYAANFGEEPAGDIFKVASEDIPAFDILFAGFPCQPFSIIGKQAGFADKTRGTLFFQIARILRDKQPPAFVLENVKQLASHDGGRTLQTILTTLRDELGYYVYYKIINALDCGLPQKRERIIIVGAKTPFEMEWPEKQETYTQLSEILEKDVDKKYYASEAIVEKRKAAHTAASSPSIWHENKSGNISSYPYSCALRAGASYNYLLVDGERRLTPREMLRLQGFPDSFKIAVSDCQIRKQAGNAVPVNIISEVVRKLVPLVF